MLKDLQKSRGLARKFAADARLLKLAGVMSKFIIEGGTLPQGTKRPSKVGDSGQATGEGLSWEKSKSRAILGTAIRYLPNTKNFTIRLGGWDKLADLFSLKLKEPPVLEFEP